MGALVASTEARCTPKYATKKTLQPQNEPEMGETTTAKTTRGLSPDPLILQPRMQGEGFHFYQSLK